jgi:hypothetical protein
MTMDDDNNNNDNDEGGELEVEGDAGNGMDGGWNCRRR